jgi:nicotinamidase-related amidase
MIPKTTLLIIDAQNDFHPGGSLGIPNADQDARRIAAVIQESLKEEKINIDRIVATLDSHHRLHIAHKGFWISGKDSVTMPDPFTTITHQDLLDNKWKPRPDLQLPEKSVDLAVLGTNDVLDDEGNFDLPKYCLEYTRRLEAEGEIQLTIWPEHCLIGTNGHNIVDCIGEAFDEWVTQTGKSIDYVHKGENNLTEMYSAMKAEVPVTSETSLNRELLDSLMKSETIIICGQALSHCVNHTVRDLMNNLPKNNSPKFILLEDCCKPVPSCEGMADDFKNFFVEQGGRIINSSQVI